MTSSLELILLFAIGALIQAILYIEDKADIWSFIACFLFGAFCFAFGLGDHAAPLLAFIGILGFSVAYAVRSRHRILPMLTEHTLLYLNISYAYFLLTHFDARNPHDLPLLALGLFPSILTLILAFYPRPLTRLIHSLAFGWFMLMNALLFIGQFIPLLSSISNDPAWTQTLHPIEMITYGSTFFLLICYFTYLDILIPLPGKYFSRRIREMKEFVWFLNTKYNPKQLRIWESVLILLIQGSLLWANSTFNILPRSFVINITILAFGLFARSSKQTKLRPIHEEE